MSKSVHAQIDARSPFSRPLGMPHNGVYLHLDVHGQSTSLNSGSCRWQILEILAVDVIESVKVIHVRQITTDLEHSFQGVPCLLYDGLQVVEGRSCFLFDASPNNTARGWIHWPLTGDIEDFVMYYGL